MGKFSESLKILDEGESILARMNQYSSHLMKEKRAKFLYRRGTIYGSLGDIIRELEYCEKALFIYEEIGNEEGIANCLNMIANYNITKGELDQGLSIFHKSLALNRELNDLESVGMILSNIGNVYIYKGEMNRALKQFHEAKAIHEKMGNKFFLAGVLLQLGFVHSLIGNLNEALEFLQQSSNIFEEVNSKNSIALVFGVIGLVYIDKGELNRALNNFQESLNLFNQAGITKGLYLSFFYRNLGRIHHVKGNFNKSLENLKKSLTLEDDIENDLFTSMTLFNIAKVYIDMNLIDKASKHIERLREINIKRSNKVIEQMYRVISAVILKTSERAIKRAESQKLFQDLSQEQLFSLELAVEVLLNLSELLLDELKTSGSEEVLVEIKTCFDKLLELSKTQHSYYLLCETYLLQSKLALLELNTTESQNLISQAELIAEEKGLGKLSSKIEGERIILQSFISRYEKLVMEKPSINDVIEITQLESLFEKMLKKRIYREQEEVLDYLAEARTLVQSAGKL
jgi:tetratricopeptide (TPR) repeat protein